ncbi:IS4 family transposase, partial [Cohnella nanjingensis]
MSVSDLCTLRQCLSLLPLTDFSAPLLDYRVRKLSCANLLKIFLSAQLCGWESLARIETEIAAHTELQTEFGCTVSASQLCRRIDDFPSCVLEALFHALIARTKHVADQSGKLAAQQMFVLDSTKLTLPQKMSNWTYVDRNHCAVKVHTRIVVLANGETIPDRITPSIGHVSDHEGADLLVVDPDATYLMDRGYVCYWRMEDWIAHNRKFVMRLNTRLIIHQVLHEDACDPADPLLLRDAIVFLGKGKHLMKAPIRLVEFKDEQGRLYRIGTTRFDLSAREIADLYRQRWRIELFFRWMKQHLKFAKLFAYKPQAVWNHILIAMIAYVLLYLVRLMKQIPQTLWQTLRLLRVYAFRSWDDFVKAASKRPTGQTRGRQKRERPPPPYIAESCDVAIVSR